jgi:outer membrane protein assembly factor BamB
MATPTGATAKVRWTESRPGKCSLIAADGHLVVLSERGTLRAIKAIPDEYVPTGELKDLLTFKSWALPALANGRLYVRDDKNILCIDLRKP